MVLVERRSIPDQTTSGIFTPVGVGKDSKRIGKVLSVPVDLSKEGGMLKVGDEVYINDPWGVGPLDLEIEKRCFSFHKR
eukprot:CAMPEP_0170362546 /NCGR_PEP_ID=MMETSP0117_2-20130122/4389_1 /TAXON_ID=400756 /ORGANISM="Durinskia baltica, Strain CSIRO CS-38" /LENGTH=78 /DNA_ID=CAMNT_0010616969 /DNA_START=235 /DNA_END=467 /DNA_ORIENTATION=-